MTAGNVASKTSNYRYTLPTAAKGSITAKEVTVAAAVLTKTYDGGTAITGAALSGGAVSGAVSSQSLTLTVSGGSYATADVGSNITISGATFGLEAGASTDKDNYTLPSSISLSGTITKKAITDIGGVTVRTRPVDGTTAASFDTTAATGAGVVTAQVAGFRSGLTVSGSFPDAAKSTAGEYDVAVTYTLGDSGTFKASNYTLGDSGDTLRGTVTGRRVLVVTPTTTTRVYGEADPSEYEYTVAAKSGSEFAAGDGASTTTFFTSNPLTRAAGNDVGEYAFSLVAAPAYGEGIAAKYTFEVASGAKYTITKKALSITTPVVLTKEYDGTTAAAGATLASGGAVSGAASGESFTLTVSGGTYPQSGVGSALTISSPTFALTAGNAASKTSNYSYTLPTAATGSITAKEVTVAAAVLTKTYDGGTAITGAELSGGAVSGAVSSQSLTLQVTGGTYASADVGSSITIDNPKFGLEAGASTDKGNYQLPSSITLTGSITKKEVTVAAAVLTKEYDGGTGISGATLSGGAVSGAVSSQSLTLQVTGGTYASVDVGTTITINDPKFGLEAGASTDKGNYALPSSISVSGTITKKAITDIGEVTVNERPVDGTTAASFDTTGATGAGVVTAELSGFRSGLTVSGSFPDDAKTAGGEYDVAVTYALGDSGTFKASNYTLEDSGDTLKGTITTLQRVTRVLVVTPTTTTRVYGEAEPSEYEYTVAAKSGSEFAPATGQARRRSSPAAR